MNSNPFKIHNSHFAIPQRFREVDSKRGLETKNPHTRDYAQSKFGFTRWLVSSLNYQHDSQSPVF